MPTYPAHHYSITHKVSEDYVLLKDSDDCMERIVFRLTNGVGSPVTSDANCWMLVVNDLCKQVAMNSEIKLRSDGSLQRDFIPISLICSVVHSAIESNAFDREIVNISSGKSLTLHELAKLIAYRSSLVLGIKPPIKFNLSLTKEVINPLIISNNKLSCIFPHKIDTNLSDEIDRLLLNCRQWFQ
jgi:UDP-glucose 4-epimerase